MKLNALKLSVLGLGAAIGTAEPARPRRQDPGRHQGARPAGLRREHRPGRLLAPPTASGNWTGLDVDVCRPSPPPCWATPSKVKYVPLNAQQRFTALQSGEVDVLSRNTTWTLTRDASLGLHFTGVTYYDGQGFMVPNKSKIKSAKQLKGATVCVQSGTTTEKNLTDFSKANEPEHQARGVREARSRPPAPTSPAAARPTPPTPRAWPRSATRKPRPGRPRDPARPDLQGAAGPDGAPRRRRVVRHRQVGDLRPDRSRGIRHHPGQCGRR